MAKHGYAIEVVLRRYENGKIGTEELQNYYHGNAAQSLSGAKKFYDAVREFVKNYRPAAEGR